MEGQLTDKYQVSDKQIREKFNSLKLKPLEQKKAEIFAQIQLIEQQKQHITNDSHLPDSDKRQLIRELDQQIAKLKKDYIEFEDKLLNSFSVHVRDQLRSLKIKEQEEKEKQRQVDEEIARHYENQKWEEPVMELQAAKNQDWMKQPLPTVVIPLVKTPQQPVKTTLSQKVQLTINTMIDSDGKLFQGVMNLNSSTCDSLTEPQKLKNLPPLVVIDQTNRAAPPASKLVSFSMQTNQFQDSKGKLIFPAQPLKVVEKIDEKKIKPQVLKEYKVWNWDVLTQKWIATGTVQVSPDGKQLKYDIKPKSRQDMLRVFESIGETRRATLPRLVFNVDKIKELIPLVKQISQGYQKQVKKAQIEHQYRINEVNSRAGIQATQKQIHEMHIQAQTLRKINLEIKASGRSLFYDKVSDYLLKKETLMGNEVELKQELIYVPQNLRDVQMHFIYRSMSKLNKKTFEFQLKKQKYIISSQEYKKYQQDTEMLREMTKFFIQGDLKKDNNLLKEIYLQSPNKIFAEKYIFVHPKTPYFAGDSLLEKINTAVDVQELINKMNDETLQSLQNKIKAWSSRTVINQSDSIEDNKNNNITQTKEQAYQKATKDLSAIYDEDKKTVAQLILESRINKIKLISTNKYLLRLQLAILFSLPSQKLQQFESSLIYTQKNTHNNAQFNYQYISRLPQYQSPSQKFLEAYCEFFKIYAEEHEETLRAIFVNRVKDSLEIEEKTMMKAIVDLKTQNFIKEIEDVFNEAVGKGLFDQKEMETLKKPKIDKIKRQYLAVQEWNNNQQLIRRIYSQFFPNCSYTASTYSQLLQSMTKYCTTRLILTSQTDINKFTAEFNSKYRKYMTQTEKGLPGGSINGHLLLATLTQKYGAQAAKAAMYTICNIDRLMNLTPEQARKFQANAQALAKVNRNNIPQFLARKGAEVSTYLNNPSNFKSNVDEALLKSNTDNSVASLNQATQTIQKQKRQNDSTIKSNLGTIKSQPQVLKDNKNISKQFQYKLNLIKPALESSMEKKQSIEKNLNSVNQLKNQLNNQIKGIDALAQIMNQAREAVDQVESQKLVNQTLEKTIQIIEQRKQALLRGQLEIEKQIQSERERNQKEVQRIKNEYQYNTNARRRNRDNKLKHTKSLEQMLSEEEEKLKMAASNSIKDLLGQKN